MAEKNAADVRPEEICAFVDTNILIHFEFLNEIDWPRALGAKCVCLAFPPITFTELDNIKDGMTKPGRREKARRVLKVISAPLEAADLNTPVPLPGRPNTSIMYASEDDLSVDPALRQEKQDDHLIAALLHYRQANPDAALLLLSDDLPCRQRAKRFGIVAQTLPEDFRRPLPLTEEEEELKRFRSLEPKVNVEFGSVSAELLLPYRERQARLEELERKYEAHLRGVFADIDQEFTRVRGAHPELRRPGGPPLFQPLLEEKFAPHLDINRFAITAAEQLGFELLEGHLEPEPRVKMYPDGDPEPSERPHYEQWQANVSLLRQWSKEREGGLFKAKQDLIYYELPITLTQVDGVGVQDGQITVILEAPLTFKFLKSPSRVDWDVPQYPFATQWQEKVETPSSSAETPRQKTLSFGNLHPGATFKCDPLYIYAAASHDLAETGQSLKLTIEVSGLNIRMSKEHRKEVVVKFV